MVEAAAKRRVGRPRSRSEGPGDYVGFRAPRELKERLETTAATSGRSLSTEAQIRLEKSFEKQDLLSDSLELAYGARLAGIVLLVGNLMKQTGLLGGFASIGSAEARDKWLDDPYAYDQALKAALIILEAFRPPGDPNLLQKNGKDAGEEIPPAPWVIAMLAAMKNTEQADRRAEKVAHLPLATALAKYGRLDPETERRAKRLLGPLVDRIPAAWNDDHA
jgi:hypothetical protein